MGVVAGLASIFVVRGAVYRERMWQLCGCTTQQANLVPKPHIYTCSAFIVIL